MRLRRVQDNTICRTSNEALRSIFSIVCDSLDKARPVLDHFHFFALDVETIHRMAQYVARKLGIVYSTDLTEAVGHLVYKHIKNNAQQR